MILLDDFLGRAVLAGIGVALAAGPLGCFVVWRRMAYFGDATAHAAILGVALSLGFSISVFAGVIVTALAMGMAVTALSGRSLAMDTLLGVAAHTALAVGLVAIALLSRTAINLEAYLFGEILAVGRADLGFIWLGALAVLVALWWRWSELILSTLSPELATAAGIDARREQLFLTFALALVVATAIKVVGALLITAMLIIPAAAARPLARTPEAMAVLAAILGVAAVFGGLALSYELDTPSGPSIVTAAALIFAITSLIGQRQAQ